MLNKLQCSKHHCNIYNIIYVPRTRMVCGSKSFMVSGSHLWNDLSPYIKDTDSLDRFKRVLKTYLFPKSFNWWFYNQVGFIFVTAQGLQLHILINFILLYGAPVSGCWILWHRINSHKIKNNNNNNVALSCWTLQNHLVWLTTKIKQSVLSVSRPSFAGYW